MADAPKILKTDSLRDSFPKLNSAIDNSNISIKVAKTASVKSDNAVSAANQAKAKAEDTQQQLNQIVIDSGTSDAEVIQARGNAPVLNERLNTIESSKINADAFYSEVTVRRAKDSQTLNTYFLTKIPKLDKDGNLIKVKRGFSKDNFSDPTLETPRDFAVRNAATVVINSSTYSTNTFSIVGVSIYNGVIQQELVRQPYNYILGIKDDNSMKAFPPETTASQILSQGYTNALTAFIPLIENGTSVSQDVINTRDIFSERHPRQAIAQDADGNTFFFTSEGRRLGEIGLTASDMIRILLSEGMVFAYMLDGGGSAQTVYCDTTINRYTDDNGKTERAMLDFLYVGKDKPANSLNESFKSVGVINKLKADEIVDYEQKITNLQANEYTSTNHIELTPYLVNGWQNYGTSGSGICRAWRLPNNSVYIVGTIKDGNPNLPFMQLPLNMRPMFTLHFLVPGNNTGEIYKVIASSDGSLQLYYWSAESSQQTDYIRLDGLFIPVWPV